MKKPIILVTTIAISLLAGNLFAQTTQDSTAEAVETTPMPIPEENTFKKCSDSIDNDSDGHVDCTDQDCEHIDICMQVKGELPGAAGEGQEPKTMKDEPQPAPPPPPRHRPELGYFCRDGRDNNNDNLIDCQETSCQAYFYCKKRMYEIPEPPNKAPGYFLNFGLGLALPGFWGAAVETEAGGYTIPFKKDVGLMLNLKTGYLFLKWLGLAVNLSFGGTVAGNDPDRRLNENSIDSFKYQGDESFVHAGGVLRFQWPFKRFVPYLDIDVGYSYLEYTWYIYDASNLWMDIHDDINSPNHDNPYISGVSYTNTEKYGHFTMAVEPGFDIFMRSRLFAIGLKAWLPVLSLSYQDKKMNIAEVMKADDIGVMLSLTYTPMWREKPRLKPEYEPKRP